MSNEILADANAGVCDYQLKNGVLIRKFFLFRYSNGDPTAGLCVGNGIVD